MELFYAGDVNRPTIMLALGSVAAACNRYPQATTMVLINVFYLEYGPLILIKTQIICVTVVRLRATSEERLRRR